MGEGVSSVQQFATTDAHGTYVLDLLGERLHRLLQRSDVGVHCIVILLSIALTLGTHFARLAKKLRVVQNHGFAFSPHVETAPATRYVEVGLASDTTFVCDCTLPVERRDVNVRDALRQHRGPLELVESCARDALQAFRFCTVQSETVHLNPHSFIRVVHPDFVFSPVW